jgi:hypothetical protein
MHYECAALPTELLRLIDLQGVLSMTPCVKGSSVAVFVPYFDPAPYKKRHTREITMPSRVGKNFGVGDRV